MCKIFINVMAWVLALVILISCNQSSQETKQVGADLPVKTMSTKTIKMFDSISNYIDTLYITEAVYRNYYDSPHEPGKRKNKAVFQVLWLKNRPYFTLGIYAYEHPNFASLSTTTQTPLLILDNAFTGSSLGLPDTLFLGDQQLKKKKNTNPPNNLLTLIKQKLNNGSTNDQLIIFAPFFNLNHLAYKIFVIPAQPGEPLITKNFYFPPGSLIGENDPSPPATSED